MRVPFFPEPGSLRPVAALVYVTAAIAATAAAPAHAVEPFAIADIRVEGLQRTDPGTVFAALPFRVGDSYTDENGAIALRALFATGLFRDVRIDIDGSNVIVIVDERPVINSVSFVGLKEFDKDTLTKSLKDAGIGEGLPFDRAMTDRAEQEIKRQYLSKSLYGAEVVTTITPIERNRVNVTFTMTEGAPSRIQDIRIIGAQAFGQGELRGLMNLTPSGWFTWYTKNDRYSRTKLNADLEALKAFYLRNGFLEFKVTDTQVTMSPDKEAITIVVTVDEGQQYTVTGVKLEGNYLGRDEEFASLVSVRPGAVYNGDQVAATAKRIGERFGDFGYAFARVEPRPEIDREKAQVRVVFSSDPQRRVYVRRIEIAGNARTRDEVIRRELRQLESSWYDGNRIKLSRDRVDRLGYFKEVGVDTVEVPNQPDQVDLVFTVEEKPTGNLTIGAGYSSADKLSFQASVRQENVFGSGHYLGIDFNTSRIYRSMQISTVDPYFTVDGVSRAIDLYYRTSRPYNSLGNQYQLATGGAAIRFGVPFSEYDTVFFGIGVERTEIRDTTALPNDYYLYRQHYGSSATSLPLTLGWQRDDRDSAIAPTRGRFQRLNVEWSVAGDARFVRTNAQYQEFYALPWKLTLGINAEAGWGKGLGGKPLPLFKNFYGGGLGSVRVFEQGSLGTVDVTGAYIGGAKRVNLNTSLYFPVPGMGNDRTFRFFAFADAGNVWATGERPTVDSLRASAGLGISWISPIGPLQMSWGAPIKYERSDRIQRFQFQIGTAF